MTGRVPRPPPQGSRSGGGPVIASHVQTVGVRRTAWGTSGRPIQVSTNHFEVKIPEGVIHHYDVILPEDKSLPAKLNLDIIRTLQATNPQMFTPKAVYDGRKNIFAVRALPLKGRDAKNHPVEDFKVGVDIEGPPPQGGKKKELKEYKVRLTKVAEINPEVLLGFLQGRQSHDNAVLTAITALNVVIRMLPISKYPFNVRSFFTDREQKDIGGGLVLWRGYFQSIRPGGNRMWINIDISTGTMYQQGPLISMCLAVLGDGTRENRPKPGWNEPTKYNDRDRIRLQRFLAGIRVYTKHTPGQPSRVIKKIFLESAANHQFQTREGRSMTVATYFREALRKNLDYPNLPCVEVGNGALIPLELCVVPPGQLMRKQVPPELTSKVLQFSTQKPHERLNSIKNGINVFEYDTSEYLQSFGMQVKTGAGPLTVAARVLQPPTLVYGGSKQRSIKPDNGAWNMRDKKFYRIGALRGWVMIIFERQQRFNQESIQITVRNLVAAAAAVGLTMDPNPIVRYGNSSQPIRPQLIDIGNEWKKNQGGGKQFPNLIVAVMPEGSTDTYTAIKHFGDCIAGVSTQCMKSNNCSRGSQQYFANVLLKLNVKLGGINCVPLAQDVPVLTDPSNPTIVFGADVIHPAPGATGRPSFTALVGNVDSENSKFVAKCCVQESRVEMIQDLRTMTKDILDMFRMFRQRVEQNTATPRKAIFYRDGVSEGQFRAVLEEEVPRIKAAFNDAGLKGPLTPKLTVIVVGKRHHVRFFPGRDKNDTDRSGNCRAGTVVDRDISHPTEFDFYLQSHAGILGTSRPSHYNVLLDENNFTPDALQQLSFALCHVYARSTRSVSIPAPVYYADIVCSRARNHFDPTGSIDMDPTSERLQGIEAYKNAFKPVHMNTAATMYFS